MRLEICVDSVENALAAQRGGADRVELCANLLEGGTTPSAGTIKLARLHLSIGLQVLVRPRAGDFLYSDVEHSTMIEDIQIAKDLGADGVVLGCLTAQGDIDLDRTRHLIDSARPMNVTFHRAFDMCRDPRAALEDLVALGVNRLLTSGQETTCLEGLDLLIDLQRLAHGRLILMPGGGLTARNVRKIVEAIGVEEVHLSARTSVESGMRFRNPRVSMGGALRPPEYGWNQTDESVVRDVVASLRPA